MDAGVYKNLLRGLDAGKRAVTVTTFDTLSRDSSTSSSKVILFEEQLYAPGGSDEPLINELRKSLATGKLQYLKGPDNRGYLIEPFFPEPRMIVFGGGHIALPLVEFADRLGFSVTVIDDRPSFANKNRFPNAARVICESFERCFDLITLNRSTFVVIVTRGHRHDMDCLRPALRYDTAYIGMIGSRRRVKSVKEQLLSEGCSMERLDRVNAPIGLDIGAVTPEEIALSIMAQVVSYKRLIIEPSGLKTSRVNWPELDPAVLTELSLDKTEPRALVTVVAAKGSVPRKPGAKMLVWPDGRTLGSIGGGCSEGEVIITARNVIRNRGYREKRIDMTGQIAEDEGMVCGGVMWVVIECLS
ncbi:MAG: xanthine dehydrogenase [Firmicutes bacterium]|nr:xanthine dehydrogenase [Bacillota bacterium]